VNTDLNLTGVVEPERLQVELVSAAYFPVLGVAPRLGRVFSADEDRAANPGRVAVLSWGLWQRRYAGDRGIVGKTVEINRETLTVVGVMPERFAGLSGAAELWVPISMAEKYLYPGVFAEDGNHWHSVVARRKAAVTEAAAKSEVEVLGRRVAEEHPMRESAAVWGASAAPLNDSRVDPALRRSVVVLFGAVTFVLLIACANVAALLLARAAGRGREVAIRLAIGAERRRIARQFLTESVVLALAGGICGVLLSLWGIESLSRLEHLSGIGDPSFLFRFAEIRIDLRVLLFALGVSLATGLIFGMAPAIHATRSDLATVLKEGGAGAVEGGHGRRHSVRGLLVRSRSRSPSCCSSAPGCSPAASRGSPVTRVASGRTEFSRCASIRPASSTRARTAASCSDAHCSRGWRRSRAS
jgi:predicted permease